MRHEHDDMALWLCVLGVAGIACFIVGVALTRLAIGW